MTDDLAARHAGLPLGVRAELERRPLGQEARSDAAAMNMNVKRPSAAAARPVANRRFMNAPRLQAGRRAVRDRGGPAGRPRTAGARRRGLLPAGYIPSVRMRTFRNLTVPAPYCRAIGPSANCVCSMSTIGMPFSVTTSRGPSAVIS